MTMTDRIARRLQAASLFLAAMAMLSISMFAYVNSANAALAPNLLPATSDNNIPPDNSAPAATPKEIRDELKHKLDEVQTFRDHMDSGGNGTKAVEGIKPEELAEQRRLIESLIFFYQDGLESLAATEAEQEKLKLTEVQAREWTGFPDPPPYSMLMVYGLEEEADALRGKQALLESSLVGWQGDSTTLETEVSRAQAAARLADNSAERERASNPAESPSAVWHRDFAQWRVRAAERNVWFKQIQAGLVNAKLSVVRAELALLDKKIAVARLHALLSESDMGKVHEGLKAAERNIKQEQQQAVSENTRWTQEREAAAQNLEAAQTELQKTVTDIPAPLQIKTLEARLRAADAWVAATRQKTETLGNLTVLYAHIKAFWDDQYTLVNSRDPQLRQNASNQLERDLARLQQAVTYTQDSLSLATGEETNQQANLDSISTDSPLRRYEMQTFEALRLKRQTAERIRLLAYRTEHLLGRWLDDYRQTTDGKPVAARFKESLLDASNGVVQIFHFELFTVDDEVDLEGKKVNITRGVTLGTLLMALAMFAVGFWFAKWFSRRFQRILVNRFNIDQTQSDVLRRWFLMGLSLTLLVIVLTFARIPLTVFAFLGGALAIGVGFGTQTMLKNLISGLVMLAAQKIKVGDIVEVDGIVGRIIEIDIRSSTVRGFDGVETMIPNSTFLESKVANWTYTNSNLRRSVRVGVAYGSSSREVIRLLLACAQQHGQVLDEPKPHVWLEDLSDSSLVFGLYFWLEIGPKVNSLQVMSDLRCMVVDALAKGGIAIPVVQQDIHIEVGKPAPVDSGGAAVLDG